MDEKVIAKLKKLWALAESSNVNEAANAAQAAQRIMTEHQIDMAMLDTSGPVEAPIKVENDFLEPPKPHRARKSPWKGSIAAALSSANGCQCYWFGANLRIIGTKASAETVRYLYAYLTREVDRLAERNKGAGRAWLNSFRIGAAAEISATIKAGRKAAVEEARAEARNLMAENPGHNGSGLARVEQAVDRMKREAEEVKRFATEHLKLKSTKGARASNADGYYAGRAAGATVNLGSGPGLGRGAAGSLRH